MLIQLKAAASLSPTDRIFHWPSVPLPMLDETIEALQLVLHVPRVHPPVVPPTPRKPPCVGFSQLGADFVRGGEIFCWGGSKISEFQIHHPKKTKSNLQNVTKFQGDDRKKRRFGERRKASLGVFFPAGKTKQDARKEREQTCREEKNELS